MRLAPTHVCRPQLFPRALSLVILAAVCLALAAPGTEAARQKFDGGPEILPLAQVRPGMQGYAYTIFAGDQIERFDLEVIGVMENFLGPGQSIILVQLKGPKVEHTGVVAGMSGSPVYIEGKLAGALSLKLGIFTKEPLAGVTPIEDVLRSPAQALPSARPAPPAAAQPQSSPAPEPVRENPLPQEVAQRTGLSGSAYLQPIETPLVFSGFRAEAIRRYAPELESYGMVATQGGTAAPRPDDAKLAAGDMAGMVLVQGDASLYSACTVTAVEGDRVFLCGHPFLGLGKVEWPMARTRVLTTLSSDYASTKIVNVGGTVGTISQDRLTAVVGRLGPAPAMIPLDISLSTASGEKNTHFELIQNPKLTPILVAMMTFQGLTQNAVYGEGTTLRLTGEIAIRGHSSVRFDNSYAPLDFFIQDGSQVAATVQTLFARIYANPYEVPAIEHIRMRVESVPERQSLTIEGAWLEKNEAAPGETLGVKVLLRPYRNAPRVVQVPITIPAQADRGASLRVLVSDANWLNRSARPPGFPLAAESGTGGLEQLIALMNKQKRNDRLYVSLYTSAPTLVLEDKELPSVPLSEMNVLDGRRAPGSVQILRESLAGEWSLPMDVVVSGAVSLTVTVK